MTNQVLPNRPFYEAAHDLCSKGLAVIPCPGSNGKSPAGAVSNFQHWMRPPSFDFVERLRSKWASANIGAVTHASGVTVVDVDGDEKLAQQMMTLCGDTPLITCTPSGGFHLWYKNAGEFSANLRSRMGLSVDIKGKAGIVVLPPSISLRTGKAYRLVSGTFDDLRHLPSISANAVRELGVKTNQASVQVGQRNNTLFTSGLSVARSQKTLEQLRSVMLTLNEAMAVPLPDSEVNKTVASVWKIQQEGRNRVGGGQYASILINQFEALARSRYPMEACWLLLRLLLAHGAKKPETPFAISAEAMEWTPLIPMAAHKIRRARQTLIDCNMLRQVSSGGKGPRDPATFVLTMSTALPQF